MYKVNFSKKARKNLQNISDPYYSYIKKSILSLPENPRPFG